MVRSRSDCDYDYDCDCDVIRATIIEKVRLPHHNNRMVSRQGLPLVFGVYVLLGLGETPAMHVRLMQPQDVRKPQRGRSGLHQVGPPPRGDADAPS